MQNTTMQNMKTGGKSNITTHQNTWGTTKYINYSFEQLSEWIKKNPYKNMELKELKVKKSTLNELQEQQEQEQEQEQTQTQNILLIKEQSTYKWLLLSGWITSEDFRSGLNTKKILYDMVTEYQTEIQNGFLTGTKLQRKKRFIYDTIGKLLDTSPPVITDSKDEAFVIETICRLTNTQWILCNSETGEITMYPTAVSEWSRDLPIYIADKNGTWIIPKKIPITDLKQWIEKDYREQLPIVAGNKQWTFSCWHNDEFINSKTKQELMKDLCIEKTKDTKEILAEKLVKSRLFNKLTRGDMHSPISIVE